MKRTERLFALAEALRARRTGITAGALAERFGVTERTIYRDLDALRESHLPLCAERGRGGGFALDKSYHLPPVNFTAREAAVLVAVGRFVSELRVVPFVDTLSSALDKVRAALPLATQREVLRLSESLGYAGVPARTPSREVRSQVERAWLEATPLEIVYEGQRGTTRRRVQITSVVMERTETLLNCVDLELGEPRQLRLHRITSARRAPAP
jgi:predicted DNA-binding transcriptional regulator YafY